MLPEEHEDFLVEFVDSNDTLHRLFAVVSGHFTDGEVTESEAREESGSLPSNAVQQVSRESPSPEDVFFLTDEVGEGDELDEGDEKVEKLDEAVNDFRTDAGHGERSMLGGDFVEQQFGHLRDLILSVLGRLRTDLLGGVAEIEDRHVRDRLRGLPKELGQHEDESGDGQVHAGPLVVLQAVTGLVIRSDVLHRLVARVPVSVLEEAVVLGKLTPITRVGLRQPALDGRADVAGRNDR